MNGSFEVEDVPLQLSKGRSAITRRHRRARSLAGYLLVTVRQNAEGGTQLYIQPCMYNRLPDCRRPAAPSATMELLT